MFRCEMCGSVQPAGAALNRVATVIRSVVYEGPGQTAKGFETVREIDACKKCEKGALKARVEVDTKSVTSEGAFTAKTSYYWEEEVDEEEERFRFVPEEKHEDWRDEDWVYDPVNNTYRREEPSERPYTPTT